MKKTNITISILSALLLGATAQAELITLGGDQTAGTGTLTINYDLVFNITTPSTPTVFGFVFDEIVLSDGSFAQVSFSGLEFSINGGAHYSLNQWVDNRTGSVGDVTANDGYITTGSAETIVFGDIVTLHAGIGTMSTTAANFNSWASGDYDVFVIDGGGNQISDVVPEPATALLFGIGGIGAFIVRRNKKAQEEA